MDLAASAVGGGGSFPVTPATPTAFDTRNTGVTLEIEPTIGENDFVIDLRFVPEIVEFEGFINYGSPIQSPGTDALGNPVTSIITENRIEMPVFSARRVNTSLTIYDGYTVAVGGLIREDVQNVEDKVPILGRHPDHRTPVPIQVREPHQEQPDHLRHGADHRCNRSSASRSRCQPADSGFDRWCWCCWRWCDWRSSPSSFGAVRFLRVES